MKNLVRLFGMTNSLSTCVSKCPLECSAVDYKIKSYQALYPNRYYANYLYNYSKTMGLNLSLSDVPYAFSKVNIYSHSMQYETTIQTEAKEPSDVIGELGGTLGLCLGMSWLSFIEIFELLFNLIYSSIKYICTKKKRTMAVDVMTVD